MKTENLSRIITLKDGDRYHIDGEKLIFCYGYRLGQLEGLENKAKATVIVDKHLNIVWEVSNRSCSFYCFKKGVFLVSLKDENGVVVEVLDIKIRLGNIQKMEVLKPLKTCNDGYRRINKSMILVARDEGMALYNVIEGKYVTEVYEHIGIWSTPGDYDDQHYYVGVRLSISDNHYLAMIINNAGKIGAMGIYSSFDQAPIGPEITNIGDINSLVEDTQKRIETVLKRNEALALKLEQD